MVQKPIGNFISCFLIAQTPKKAIGTRSTLDTMKISLDMEVQIEISLRT
jgi:hypothetical protein